MYFHYIDSLEVINGKHFVRGYRSRFSFFFVVPKMIHKGSTWDGQKGGPKDLQGGSPGGPFFMYWWMTRMNKCTQWLKHASSSNPTNHKVSLRKKLTSSLHFWIGGKTFERLVHLSNCNLSSRGDPGAPWWPPFEILMVRRTFFLKRDSRAGAALYTILENSNSVKES